MAPIHPHPRVIALRENAALLKDPLWFRREYEVREGQKVIPEVGRGQKVIPKAAVLSNAEIIERAAARTHPWIRRLRAEDKALHHRAKDGAEESQYTEVLKRTIDRKERDRQSRWETARSELSKLYRERVEADDKAKSEVEAQKGMFHVDLGYWWKLLSSRGVGDKQQADKLAKEFLNSMLIYKDTRFVDHEYELVAEYEELISIWLMNERENSLRSKIKEINAKLEEEYNNLGLRLTAQDLKLFSAIYKDTDNAQHWWLIERLIHVVKEESRLATVENAYKRIEAKKSAGHSRVETKKGKSVREQPEQPPAEQ